MLSNIVFLFSDYVKGWDLCVKLINAGVLAKNSNDTTVRFLPPLTVTANEIEKAVSIIESVIKSLKK